MRWIALIVLLMSAGCGDDGAPSGREATLDLELLDSVDLKLAGHDPDVTVTLTLSKGFGVAPAGTPIEGPGRIELIPEAEAVLTTARIDAPADPSGPCGAEPVSLALSLHADGDSDYVAGGLTPYCGAGVWYGIPAREPLRISGHMDLARSALGR